MSSVITVIMADGYQAANYAKDSSLKHRKTTRETDPKIVFEAIEARPIKIAKSLLRPTDVAPVLMQIGEGLDPIQLLDYLASNVNQLQRQVENLGNVVDLKVRSWVV